MKESDASEKSVQILIIKILAFRFYIELVYWTCKHALAQGNKLVMYVCLLDLQTCPLRTIS